MEHEEQYTCQDQDNKGPTRREWHCAKVSPACGSLWGILALPFAHMRRLLLLLSLLTATGLLAQRRQLEKAAAYEQAGAWQEAFDRYAEIRQRRPRSVEAHVGMTRNAQLIFDRMQQEASAMYLVNDYDTGETKRREAIAYRSRMVALDLDLQLDPMLEVRRREARTLEADRLYGEAETAYRADRFAEAEQLVTKSLVLEGERNEAAYLLILTQLEPLYRQGVRASELGLWRDAFRAFKRVTDRDAGYRDAWARLAEARDKAQVVLSYVPLFDRAMYGSSLALGPQGQLEGQLAALSKQAILDLNEPLIMLVDRDNTTQLLAEQQRNMTGLFDDRYVVEAGKLIGARYVLTARILRYDEVIKREIEVQMQLLDAENGRIHISEIIRVDRQQLAKGNTRSQLLGRVSARMARRVAEFDPHQR